MDDLRKAAEAVVNHTGSVEELARKIERLGWAVNDTDPEQRKAIGLVQVWLNPEYRVSYGSVLCESCGHPHTEGSWTERDPNDGTCWNAGSLVCGCPKFITPSVAKMRRQDAERKRAAM